jgi:DNA polymerase-3 subunit gamma/tau
MVVKRGEGDLTQVYRPCKLSEVVGNHEAKKIIKKAFEENKIPHNFLFHGLSGTGKTTMARIIEMGLNCENSPTSEPCCECTYCRRIINRKGSLAVKEINAVEVLKDDLKQLLSEFDAYGFGTLEGHKKSVLLIDECHGLTDDQAGLFLKYTEDVHDDNYFIFCTTDPDKFLDTLRNRCTIQLPFEKLGDQKY